MTITTYSDSDLHALIGLSSSSSVNSTTDDERMLGFSTTSMAGFGATSVRPMLVMSTGNATEIFDPTSNEENFLSTDYGGSQDKAEISIVLGEDDLNGTLSFDFVFLSEEFPEFVGTDFDDTFSVKINGEEYALDEAGNFISINSVTFDESASLFNTGMDGRTKILTTSINMQSLNLGDEIKITLADKGDNIYDSAALIGNFHISEGANPTQNANQIVYINFDGTDGVAGNSINFDSVIRRKSKDLDLDPLDLSRIFHFTNEELRADIKSNLEAVFSNYSIDFVIDRPVSGSYSTLHITDEKSEDVHSLIGNHSVYGLAESVDLGNADRSDQAIVFAGEFVSRIGKNGLSYGNIDSVISNTAAHELGHLFGLAHVLDDDTEIMTSGIKLPGHSFIDKDMSHFIVESDESKRAIDYTQNSDEILGANVGYADGSKASLQSGYEVKLAPLKIEIRDDLPEISESYLLIMLGSNVVIEEIQLDDILAGGKIDMMVNLPSDFTLFFNMKSAKTGEWTILTRNELQSKEKNIEDIFSSEQLVADTADHIDGEEHSSFEEYQDNSDIVFFEQNEVFSGTNGDDVITLSNIEEIATFNGNDVVTISGESANIDLGQGDDVIILSSGGHFVNGGAGSDTVKYDLNLEDLEIVDDPNSQDVTIMYAKTNGELVSDVTFSIETVVTNNGNLDISLFNTVAPVSDTLATSSPETNDAGISPFLILGGLFIGSMWIGSQMNNFGDDGI